MVSLAVALLLSSLVIWIVASIYLAGGTQFWKEKLRDCAQPLEQVCSCWRSAGAQTDTRPPPPHEAKASEMQPCTTQLPSATRQPSVACHECTICMEPLKGQTVTAGLCAHVFHIVCIDSWMARSGQATCPICRGQFSDVGAGRATAARSPYRSGPLPPEHVARPPRRPPTHESAPHPHSCVCAHCMRDRSWLLQESPLSMRLRLA